MRHVPAPVQIGGRVHHFLRTTDRKPPVFCFACLGQYRSGVWPTVVEPLWSGEVDSTLKCESCGILLLDIEPHGAEPSGEWWGDVEGAVRDEAVRRVDGREGYTCEFAPSPEQHREEYRAEEAILWSQVVALAATRAQS